MTFDDFHFEPEIIEGLVAMGFEKPTPIQEQTIPPILDNKDMIGCAQTGTGKTAAYLLPIINKMVRNANWGSHISTLIIVPTRELALQIDQQLSGFAYFAPISSISVYGGNDSSLWDQQKKAMVKGVDIVIATPGRLLSHINLGYVNFDDLQHLVLDEADRMLDMGFYDDIMKIINYLPKSRQTLLFSATMPPKIRELTKKILKDPVQINIAISKPAEGILQAVYMVPDGMKNALICNLLKDKDDVKSIIIFSSTKSKVKNIERDLRHLGRKVQAIHSDLDQKDREDVMREFRNRKYQILVATDIISRGIDIENIDLVVNYDVPPDAEDYIHRIGRTARAENTGVAITLVNDKDRRNLQKIEKFLGKPIYKIPLPADL